MEKKKPKKRFFEKLNIAANATKNIGLIVTWLFLILLCVVGIPTIIMMVKVTAQVEDFLGDIKTDKSVNIIGTLIDENGAKILADAFKEVHRYEKCDFEEITFDIDYDGRDGSVEIEKENSTEMSRDKTCDTTDDEYDYDIFNSSNYSYNLYDFDTDETSPSNSNIQRDYLMAKNVSNHFKLTYRRKSEGCEMERGTQS